MLQVLLFPLQTGGSGSAEEPDPAFPVDYLPMLRSVVEFDGTGTADFEPAKLM